MEMVPLKFCRLAACFGISGLPACIVNLYLGFKCAHFTGRDIFLGH